jgi:O-antigen ligase
MTSRARRLALAAVPLWFTFAIVFFNTPWRAKFLVSSVFAATVASPGYGLLIVAALAPLGRLIEIGLNLQPYRIGEAITLAFLAGWLLRPDTGRRSPSGPRAPAIAMTLVAAAVCASIVAQAVRVSQYPGELPDTLRILFQAYYLAPDRIGFDAGARLLEGLGLVAATTVLLRADVRLAVRLPVVMTAAAIAAALSSLLVTRGIAPSMVLAEQARLGSRISAHVADVNAAASYFGMLLFVALGMAARRRPPPAIWRTWLRSRMFLVSLLWLAAAGAEAAALWATGSRTGVAVAAIMFCVAAVLAATAWARPRARTVTFAVLAVAAVTAGAWRARTLQNDPGTSFRRQFTIASVHMIAARPALGVGIGQYYDTSPLFLTPEMAWVYGSQNAHNYFLQIGGELGLVGLAFFLGLMTVIVWQGVQALAVRPDDLRLLGCLTGAVALLITSLTGHPLLVDEVASTFWILLGLVVALSGSALRSARGHDVESGRRRRRPAVVGGVAFAALLLAALSVARRPIEPPISTAVDGLEPWETAPDGARFRWTHASASVFVPRDVTRVYIPVRLPTDNPRISPIAVDVHAGGATRGRMLVGDSWAILNVELSPLQSLLGYKRVDLRMDKTWQPAIYVPGSSDLRRVGVQVGDLKLFREY